MNDPRALGRIIFWALFTAFTIYCGIKYGWKKPLFDFSDRKKKE